MTADLRDRLRAALTVETAPSSDFDLNPDFVLPDNRVLKPAAVLVGVIPRDGGRVVLTKRSSRLKHHPGQIAFPGGKADEGDGSPEATALREAREEIGLPERHVLVLGTLPAHETVTGFHVTPVLAWIDAPFDPIPEAGEVAEVFDVPIGHVTAMENYVVEARRWRGKDRRYYAVPWGPYYIWGATARMLRGLAERMTA